MILQRTVHRPSQERTSGWSGTGGREGALGSRPEKFRSALKARQPLGSFGLIEIVPSSP